jgi:hypothetical protein
VPFIDFLGDHHMYLISRMQHLTKDNFYGCMVNTNYKEGLAERKRLLSLKIEGIGIFEMPSITTQMRISRWTASWKVELS